MIITLRELFDLVIMTVAVGFIFKEMFKEKAKPFLFACLVTAPALIAHELAHKFVALGFGLVATFHAAYKFLALGLILKLVNFPFIFFVPGYVSIQGLATPVQSALIAFSGPLLNGVLFLIAYALLKQKSLKTNTYILLHVTKQINGFLFIFNLLPIPGFDGWTFYLSLGQAIFS